MRYLSLDWIDAMAASVAANHDLQALAADTTFGVTQVVNDGPEGTVLYHLQLAGGRATFGAGAAPSEDIRMEQSWDTTVGVATHRVPAQEVFVQGLVTISGDIQKLRGADPVFTALNDAFAAVRGTTTYG